MWREHAPREAGIPERIIPSYTVMNTRRSRSSHDQEGADGIGGVVAFLFFPIFQGKALVSSRLTLLPPDSQTCEWSLMRM